MRRRGRSQIWTERRTTIGTGSAPAPPTGADSVVWFTAYDPRADRWAMHGLDVEGRRVGTVGGLERPGVRSPNGSMLATAVVDRPKSRLRVTLLDAGDGTPIVDLAGACLPARALDGDSELDLAFSADVGYVLVLVTTLAHRVCGVVEKPDPEGGPPDDVAVGPWDIQRSLHAVPIDGSPPVAVSLPTPPGTLAAAALEVTPGGVVVHRVSARPVRTNGTKSSDAGFDVTRTTWTLGRQGLDWSSECTARAATRAVPGNRRDGDQPAVDRERGRAYAPGGAATGGIAVLSLPELDAVDRWHAGAGFDLVAVAAAGRVLAKPANSNLIVVFDPCGRARALADLGCPIIGVVGR